MRHAAALRYCVAATLLGGSGGCAGFAPAQIGQIAGTIVGSAVAPGIGAPLGALLGILTGSAVQHQMDKVTESRERVDLGQQLKPQPAPPSAPTQPLGGTPTRVWVDETLQDGRLVAGHFDIRHLP